MKKITLLISGLLIIGSGIFAQKHVNRSSSTISNPNGNRCSTTEAMKMLRDKNPAAFDERKIKKELELQNWIANNYDAQAKKAIITIPVVVQIWANTSTVPDSKVTEQIQRLNDDFGRTNSDAGNTPGVFSAVDCEIQFCLATVDPGGSPTTGIVRKTAGGSPANNTVDLWNTSKYLNLYVYSIGGGILGFAYLSSQAPNNAVHIDKDNFGNGSGPYNLGRTATHEVGHFLNLEHIWGDANCGNDFVSDTPPAQQNNYGCKSHPWRLGTCPGNTTGEMYMNYMDYVNDNCMNAFTAGQKTRMIAAINNHRAGLLTSNAANCSALPVDAIFSANVTTINAGQTVTFTDASTSSNTINSWTWDFDVAGLGGVSPGTMGSQGPHVVTYSNPGTYTVSLLVGDGSGTDTETNSLLNLFLGLFP